MMHAAQYLTGLILGDPLSWTILSTRSLYNFVPKWVPSAAFILLILVQTGTMFVFVLVTKFISSSFHTLGAPKLYLSIGILGFSVIETRILFYCNTDVNPQTFTMYRSYYLRKLIVLYLFRVSLYSLQIITLFTHIL